MTFGVGVMKFLKNAFDDFSSIMVVDATSNPENSITITSNAGNVYAKCVVSDDIGFISVDIGDTIFETSFISIELKLFFILSNELSTSSTLFICASNLMLDEFNPEPLPVSPLNIELTKFL